MTPQEAITTLNLIRGGGYNSLDYRRVQKACTVAIELLTKQIPKKPLNPCGRYYGKAKGGNCPVCGAQTNSVTYTYCRKCGQKLDWSDT